jgi:predicted permease
VAAQIALSLLLVVAAGLFLRTFISLNRVPLGLATDGLVIVDVNLQRLGGEPADRAAIMARLRDATAAVPGVTHAAASMITPLSGRGWNTGIGDQALDSRERMSWMNGVTPDWFTTVGGRLITGRDFSTADSAGSEKVAIVNETFAARFLKDGPVVGHSVQSGRSRYTVVGLVTDMAYRTPREGMVPTMYVPLSQTDRLPPSLSIIVQAPGMPSAMLTRSLSDALGHTEPNVAFTYRSFDDLISATVAQERIVAALSAGFGALAVILAAIGLYGVMSYSVSRQRTDFGVRMALGASPRVILQLVVRRASVPLAAGLCVGAGASVWASGLVGALLFDVRPRDAATIAGAALLLLIVGLLAATIPAWRASRIDPARVLREG